MKMSVYQVNVYTFSLNTYYSCKIVLKEECIDLCKKPLIEELI